MTHHIKGAKQVLQIFVGKGLNFPFLSVDRIVRKHDHEVREQTLCYGETGHLEHAFGEMVGDELDSEVQLFVRLRQASGRYFGDHR